MVKKRKRGKKPENGSETNQSMKSLGDCISACSTVPMSSVKESPVVIVPADQAQNIRSELEKLHLWDGTYKLKRLEDNCVAIPVKADDVKLTAFLNCWPHLNVATTKLNLPISKKEKMRQVNSLAQLQREIAYLLQEHNISENLLAEVPSKWERHGDLIIIPSTAFASSAWSSLGDELWQTIAKSLSCVRLARHSPVSDNGFRSSKVVMLLGTDGAVVHNDNGIKYFYDVTKCMFSAGNITEKLRIASLYCHGETIVDLYAGIGYFTLPYLVHAKAAHVHACEWNPNAIKVLKYNLQLNGVAEICTIHEGDNRLVQLPPVADRVNLGLIPSSEEGWPVAVRVLKLSGGWLHIHGNVTTLQSGKAQSVCNRDNVYVCSEEMGQKCPTNEENSSNHTVRNVACKNWSNFVQDRVRSLLQEIKGGDWSVEENHIEIVKSYAPHIIHVVVDLFVNPLQSCETVSV